MLDLIETDQVAGVLIGFNNLISMADFPVITITIEWSPALAYYVWMQDFVE